MNKEQNNRYSIIILDLLIILAVLAPLCLYLVPNAAYVHEAKKYLEDKYNEKFSISLLYEKSYTESGNLYSWEAKSKSNSDKIFYVIREAYIDENDNSSDRKYKVHFSDTYPIDSISEDIVNYYEKRVKSYWENVIAKFFPLSSPEHLYKDYSDYLKDGGYSILVYIKYDDNFNYDVEAEKIYNLMKNEKANENKANVEIYYITDEKYKELTTGEVDYVIEDDGLIEYYEYNLDSESLPIKEMIIEDMKKEKESLSYN